MHLAFHVLIGTMAIVYICFKTRLALIMAYIHVNMCMSQKIFYIFVRMRLAFHGHFGTLIMVYIFNRMCLAFHVPIKTINMVYILLYVWPFMFLLKP
jgi:hypothetical protein